MELTATRWPPVTLPPGPPTDASMTNAHSTESLQQRELSAWHLLGSTRPPREVARAILDLLVPPGTGTTAVLTEAGGLVTGPDGFVPGAPVANLRKLDVASRAEVLVNAGWPKDALPVLTVACTTQAGHQGTLLVGPQRPGLLELARVLARPLAVVLAREAQAGVAAEERAGEGWLNRTTPESGAGDKVLQIVGMHGGLKDVVTQAGRVAETTIPVLILGETGAGKELLARLIHERSARRDGPLVRVNCGAIPAELVDSELFGHERGSFTGAVQARRGWFERADGGTLFLDEVGELPLAAQVRLLRVLQDGLFERVGGQEQRQADVRVIAATHRDLPAMVRDGKFREDLWYRLSVFPVRLPPLRERPGDLPALTRHFAAQAGARLGWSGVRPTDDDLRQLAAYPWPGNVRELAAVIERAVLLGHGQRLDLSAALAVGASVPLASTPQVPVPAGPTYAPPTLDAAQVRQIEDALRQTRGRIEGQGGAADRLGVNPHTLRARMRKFGIDWARFRLGA